jgi:SSS family solute:Na+ symporter
MSPIYLFLLVASLMLVIGYFAGRKQDNDGYNLYGRKLSKWGYLVSYAATFVGAGFFITGTAYAYKYGLGLAWFFLGMIFGIIIFGFFAKYLKEKTKNLNLYTLPDYFKWRFGLKAAKILTIIALLLLAGDISIQLIAGGKLLQSLGVMNYSISIAITVIVVAIYLISSGFRAVVWTDYVLMASIIILTAILAVFSGKYFQPNSEQLNLFTVPMGTTIGFFLFGLFGPFSISSYYQRVFAARDPETARKGTWLSSLAIILPGIGLFIIGIAAKILFPEIDPDLAFLKIIQLGGKTIAILGALVLWAALMSTVDTLTFVGSQILNRDLLNKDLSRKNVGIGVVILLGFGVTIGFILPSVTSVALVFLGGGMVVAPSSFFQWFMKSLKQYSVVASLIGGSIILLAYSIFKGISPNNVAVAFAASTLILLSVHFVGKIFEKKIS